MLQGYGKKNQEAARVIPCLDEHLVDGVNPTSPNSV